MLVNVSLRELIEKGSFGPVHLGMSRGEVIRHLGEPTDWSAGRKFFRAGILKYGDFEFHFDPRDGLLWLIHLEEFSATTAGSSVRLDPWIIRPALTLSETEITLTRRGVSYHVSYVGDWGGDRCLYAGAGVSFLFDGGDGRPLAFSRAGTGVV